ncbi:MAG: hypothetical protein ACR2GT_01950 [Gaiellaceae bacterium]
MAEAISDHDRAAGRPDPREARASGSGRDPEPQPARRPLGSFLTERGFISEAQLAEGLEEGALTGARLGEVVVRRGWASEDDVAKLLAEQWQLGYVERASIYFDAEALTRLSRAQARQLEAIPTRMKDGHVVVAVAEPTQQRLAALRAVIGDDTVVVVVPKTALDAGLRSELLSGTEDEVLETAEQGADELEAGPPPAFVAPTPPSAAEPPRLAAPTPANLVEQPELKDVLAALEAAARDATTLQLTVSELARRLDGIVDGLAAAAAGLDSGEANGGENQENRENREKIRRLEEELAQRTEMTDGLKAQLLGLTRALEDYR